MSVPADRRGISAQQRVALVSVGAAAALVAMKLTAGLLSGSLGLVADAAHSGTDLVAALLTFLALRVAVRPPDREHPYGHGKAEHLAALGEAAFLVLVSAFIAVQAGRRLAGGVDHEVEAAWYALAVLGVVLVVDVSRATLSWRAARAHSSPALAASALHFASDFLGSLAVLAGLLLVSAGYPEADAIAALLVAVLVVVAAVSLMRENVQVLMDRSPAGAVDAAREAIRSAEPRAEVRRLRLREAAGRHFVDAVIGVSADAAVGQGHEVADSVERAVRAALPNSDVVVHIEPKESTDLRERATGAALTVRGVREVHNVRLVSIEDRVELSLHLKLPAGQSLADAHDVASRVEAAIAARVPEVTAVHVHIEPLAGPLTAAIPSPAEEEQARAAIEAVVREVTGGGPAELRLYREPGGLVALLTVRLPGESTLAASHDTAGLIAARVRERHPGLARVVVHTEPG